MLNSGDGGGGGGGGEAVHTSSMTGIGEDERTQSSGGGGGGGVGGDLFEGDRSTGGNRWPRQETLALLKIRSDMDVTFRDSSLKGPLWEQVSRKMEELGYHRSAKKCKEKFENVYKYHKRTKDGRVGKSDGKTYRFFDQLQALEQHQLSITATATATATTSCLPPLPQVTSQTPPEAAVPVTMVIPVGTNPAGVTVPLSTSHHPVSVVHTSSIPTPQQQQQQINVQLTPQPQVIQHQQQQQQQQQQHSYQHRATHSSVQMENPSSGSPSATQSTSSSTSSDEEVVGMKRKRKRKWKDFFEKLVKEVIDKQEELQKRFLEAVEKREHDRVVREDAWKIQEMERLNRERDILVQERSMAAAKDAALIAFLQKLSDQQHIPLPLPIQAQAQAQVQAQVQVQAQARATTPPVVSSTPLTTPQAQLQPQPQPQNVIQPQINVVENPLPSPPPPPPQPRPQPVTPMPLQTPPHLQQAMVVANSNNGDNVIDIQKENNGDNLLQPSSSRWPKAEIEALINLRTRLDQKYQENGPKGPLWEEISALMKKLGYNRNAKRCKEKWENINKYFKKVKESNKKRPEDSKTCPYFHQLDALYRERSKMEVTNQTSASMAPITAQPEQQWPPIHRHSEQIMEDHGSENPDDSEEDDGDEDEEEGNGYEVVANNNNNVNAG